MNVKYARILVVTGIAVMVIILLLTFGFRMEPVPEAGEVLEASPEVAEPALPEHSEQTPEPETTIARAGAAPGRQAQRVPLPPSNLPLSDVLDELKQRADAGDARAACRLGLKLKQCADTGLRSISLTTDDQVPSIVTDARLSTQAQEVLLQEFLGARDRAKAIVEGCRSINTFQSAQAAHYTLQAAQAGNVDSMMEFARGVMTTRSSEFLANPILGQLYQRNFMPMLLRALQAGEPDAVVYLEGLSRQPDLAFLV